MRRRVRSMTVATAAALALAGLAPIVPASAAEPQLPDGAVVEQFDSSTLGPLWTVQSPDASQYSLTEKPGSLRIHSLPGDTWQGSNSARNLVLRDVPRGDFEVVAALTAPVALDFQNAGILAWQDTDNYLRAGLANVGFAGGTVIENGLEVNAGYASTFTARAGVTTEVLKVARAGDVFTTSYWDGAAWVQAAQVTAKLDVTQVGVYAFSAQNGSSLVADFDYVAVATSNPQPVTLKGRFGLDGGTAAGPFLALGPAGDVQVSAKRSPTQLVLTTEALGDGVALREVDSGRYLAAGPNGRIALSAKASAAARTFKLLDAGGGKIQLASGTGDPVGVRHGGLAVLPGGTATRFTVRPYDEQAGALTVDGTAKGTAIGDDLYGIFYEDINQAADGGLYAELVRNRSFEFAPEDNSTYTPLTAWTPVLPAGVQGKAEVTGDQPLNATNLHYLRVTGDAAGAGISNAGYNAGIALKRGAGYRFSIWARSATGVPLTVAVRSADGASTYASGTVNVRTGGWAKYEVPLRASATTDAGRLVVSTGAAATVDLDEISLFPKDTFKGRPNGLRKDLAQLVADLKPSFLRFPGGCVANVGSFEPFPQRKRIYRWKDTIGPVEARPTNFNFWGYNQSYGLGYLEYLQFAEDIGAAPLPVVAVGVTGCGGTDRLTTEAELAPFVQDTLDLIEFANGPVTSTWGAVRAGLGHPKPFGLEYIALGNEEYDPQFYANYPHFARAIEAAYPKVKVISNSGQSSSGAVFDRSWAFAKDQGADLVDEHYYNSPAWFLANNHRYDSYDRNGPKVFVGEYASQGNAFGNAVAEASYLTGLERNADVVKLAAYAPLLANVDYVDWTPDLIWFDNDQAYPSASYHVQKLFSTNRGDTVLPSTFSGGSSGTLPDIAGGVGLATWNTQARYDNVKVTGSDGGVLLDEDFASGAANWTPATGTWAVEDGQYVQSSTATDARSTAGSATWTDYTLDLDATKTAGAEGFLVMFGVKDTGNYYWWNLGGWGNTTSAVEKATGGGRTTIATSPDTIETGRTYHLKIVLQGRTVKLYLDGRLVNQFEDNLGQTDPLYQVVTKDTKTGDTIVKVVNARDTALRTDVALSGPRLGDTATVTSLTGAPGDLNSLTEPDKVAPVTLRHTLSRNGLGNRFRYDFPANSVSFLRLPGRR